MLVRMPGAITVLPLKVRPGGDSSTGNLAITSFVEDEWIVGMTRALRNACLGGAERPTLDGEGQNACRQEAG
jgi:hypothetical protein